MDLSRRKNKDWIHHSCELIPGKNYSFPFFSISFVYYAKLDSAGYRSGYWREIYLLAFFYQPKYSEFCLWTDVGDLALFAKYKKFLQIGWLSNYEWPLPGWYFPAGWGSEWSLPVQVLFKRRKHRQLQRAVKHRPVWGRIWLLNLPKWIVTSQLKATFLNMESVFHLHTALHFSNSDLSYWNLGQAEYLTVPNPFYLFLTMSLSVQTPHVSSDNKEKEEFPTDEVLLEEARLHVVIIQIVSILHIICFLFIYFILAMFLILTCGFQVTRKMFTFWLVVKLCLIYES